MRAGLRRIVTCAAAAAVGLPLFAGTNSACQLKDVCDRVAAKPYCAPNASPSDEKCRGVLIDPETWVSTPLDDGLPYDGQREWQIYPTFSKTSGAAATIYEVVPYIAASLGEPTQWVVAPGNLAEINVFNDPSGPYVYVHNDTCANYYLRVVVRALPAAGADSGAKPADAATE